MVSPVRFSPIWYLTFDKLSPLEKCFVPFCERLKRKLSIFTTRMNKNLLPSVIWLKKSCSRLKKYPLFAEEPPQGPERGPCTTVWEPLGNLVSTLITGLIPVQRSSSKALKPLLLPGGAVLRHQDPLMRKPSTVRQSVHTSLPRCCWARHWTLEIHYCNVYVQFLWVHEGLNEKSDDWVQNG